MPQDQHILEIPWRAGEDPGAGPVGGRAGTR